MTLLEVMLAAFFLVIVFGAALSTVVQVGRVVVAAKNRTRAVTVLNQKLEEMRSLTFANLSTSLGSSGFLSGTETDIGFTGTSTAEFRWTRTVDAAADDASENLFKVVVTVSWIQGGQERSLRAYSYFSRDGIVTAESAAT